MVLPHLLVGLLEGAVTAGVYAYVRKMSPGLYMKEILLVKSLYMDYLLG